MAEYKVSFSSVGNIFPSVKVNSIGKWVSSLEFPEPVKQHTADAPRVRYEIVPDYDELAVQAEKNAKEIVRYAISDDFVEGEVSRTQLYLEKLAENDRLSFRESFKRAWLKLYELENPNYLYVFASIASCLPYEWLEEDGITLILGCSSHADSSVNEACIRMAEAWEQPNHAMYLEKMREFEFNWLETYKTETIGFLHNLSKG